MKIDTLHPVVEYDKLFEVILYEAMDMCIQRMMVGLYTIRFIQKGGDVNHL
jgi:hypothetical protein